MCFCHILGRPLCGLCGHAMDYSADNAGQVSGSTIIRWEFYEQYLTCLQYLGSHSCGGLQLGGLPVGHVTPEGGSGRSGHGSGAADPNGVLGSARRQEAASWR